jgi:hypothetical protein
VKDTSFTGQRLDLLRAVRMDRTVTDASYRVMSVIVDHLNAGTERTKLADATIAFEAGCTDRSVRRARQSLAEAGWLKWARTGRTANIYWAKYTKVAPLLAMLKRERSAKHKKFNETAEKSDLFGQKWPITPQSTENAPQSAEQEVSQNSVEVDHDRPEMAERIVSQPDKSGQSDRPDLSAIHLRSTPKKKKKEKIERARGRKPRARTTIPPDLEITDQHLADAEHQGLNTGQARAEFPRFVDYHLAKADDSADWRASWRTWCGNRVKWNKEAAEKQQRNGGNGGRPTGAYSVAEGIGEALHELNSNDGEHADD